MILSFTTRRFFVILMLLTFVSPFFSCKDNLIIDPSTVEEDVPTWTRFNGVYGAGDTTILASYRYSDTVIMLSTLNGLRNFNTLKNKVDVQHQLNIGLPIPFTSAMNEYATAYLKGERIVLYDNDNLAAPPLWISTKAYDSHSIFSFQGDRMYYQYDIEDDGGNKAIWKIRYVDLDTKPVDGANPAWPDLSQNEVQIPLDSFIRVSGALNDFWSFDEQLFVSYYDYFYRINRDGSYKRLSYLGNNIYPNKMFKIGRTLFALSNSYLPLQDRLFFSNDHGDTWEPYPNNDDYPSYEILKNGEMLTLDDTPYLSGGFASLSRWNYVDQKLRVDQLSFKDVQLSTIESLHSVNSRYVYAVNRSGVYRINKSVFTNQ